MAQLARIGTAVKWRWGLKESPQGNREGSEDEDDGDDKKRSEKGPREGQKKGTLLPVFY